MDRYFVRGTVRFESRVELSKLELAYALEEVIGDLRGQDAKHGGTDWVTDGDAVLGGLHYETTVCERADVARLVDAINVLRYGNPLHADEARLVDEIHCFWRQNDNTERNP
jgi:hypothetical protein